VRTPIGWRDILNWWASAMQGMESSVADPVLNVALHDPHAPSGREPELHWWPKNSLLHLQTQAQADLLPGPRNPAPAITRLRAGQRETLRQLLNAQGDPDRVAAIMIAASLHPIVTSYIGFRGGLAPGWPRWLSPSRIYDPAIERIGCHPWTRAQSYVLPFLARDLCRNYTSVRVAVESIAMESRLVLLQYQAVQIVFGPDIDPRVRDRAKEIQAERNAEVVRARELERQKRVQQEAFRRTHPKSQGWPYLGRADLERLVWSKPTVEIAREFGVSDSAVGKRCRDLGVRKPPRGFWARVEAGREPHPHGVAPID